MKIKYYILILVWIGFLPQLFASDILWDYTWEISENGKDWKRVDLPKNLYLELEDLNSEEIYLRASLYIENSKPPQHPIAMRLGIILDRDQFYFNGTWINHTSLWDSSIPQGYDKDSIYDIPTELFKRNEKNTIALHVKKYFPNEIGIAQDRIKIDFSDKLWKDYYNEEIISLGFLTFCFAVSGYFLFLYFRRRKDREYLYFSLFTLNLILYQFLRTQSKFSLPLEFWELKYIEYLLLPSLFPLFAHFIRTFLGFSYSKAHKFLDTLSMISLLYVLIETNVIYFDIWNRYIIQPTWGLYAIGSFTMILKKSQYGDYFLTSLLLKPLHIFTQKIVDLEINIITKLKKKFQFKERDYEIGGDISMVHEIELRGEDSLFFMNSDSMGKSIQGTGGFIFFDTKTLTKFGQEKEAIDSLERLRIRNNNNPSFLKFFQQIDRKSLLPKQIPENTNVRVAA